MTCFLVENAVSWTACETYVHGLWFIPLILRDTVFRDWAVEQGCQEGTCDYSILIFVLVILYWFINFACCRMNMIYIKLNLVREKQKTKCCNKQLKVSAFLYGKFKLSSILKNVE